MINKLTEFEMLMFLKYDELYHSLTRRSGKSSRHSAQLSNSSYYTSKFSLSLLNLERLEDLFEICSQLMQ